MSVIAGTAWRILGLPICGLALAGPAWAQPEPTAVEASYTLVTLHRVEPSKLGDYEANRRQWVEAFRAAEMGEEGSFFATAGVDFTYAYIRQLSSLEEIDGTSWTRQLRSQVGPERFAALTSQGEAVVEERRELLRPLPELSYQPKVPLTAPPGHVRLGIHQVKPQHRERMLGLLEELRKAYVKTDYPFPMEAHEVLFGEGSISLVVLAPDEVSFRAAPKTVDLLKTAFGAERAE
ncbi:MAG: hypothetical protein KDD47_23875, partial [Acidobacteria bacterium]|nr:hypothetical protein [Acidobacteriota bacterium]